MPIYLFIYLFILLTYLCTYLLTYLLTYLFIHIYTGYTFGSQYMFLHVVLIKQVQDKKT